MNDLSLMILLADFLGNLKPALIVLGCFLVSGWACFVFYCSVEDRPMPSVRWTVIGLILMTLGTVVPNKNTILMIAASETAQDVAMSPVGQEVLNDLRKALVSMTKETDSND